MLLVRDRDRRTVRPNLEPLEGRTVLSAIIAVEAASLPKVPAAITLAESHAIAGAAAVTGGIGTTTTPTVPVANPPLPAGLNAYTGNTGAQGNGNGLSNNISTPLLGNGFPTPAELARETYRSAFTGRYYTGPGRFTSQGTTYYYRGIGGSNMFLHGDFDMAIITPVGGGTQFIGEAVLQDKSTNSAGIQGLTLLGNVTDVDSKGRPTKMTFTADPNIYSGAFFVEAGQGTVSIKYGANNSIKVNFNGLIYTTGLASPLVNQDLYARQGRPIPFHPPTSLAQIHKG